MDFATYINFVLALIFVLSLIGLLAWGYRRFALGGKIMGMGAQNRAARLEILETRPIDAKRRLVLFRRDDRQHLVILGPNSETVIETGIDGQTPPMQGKDT